MSQPARDLSLEALRGGTALLVAASHLLFLDFLQPGAPRPEWLRHVEAGHSGVLLFFVLSGYVIAWTCTGECTASALGNYTRRRIVRILPIYLCALAISLLAACLSGRLASDGPRILVALFFLQNVDPVFGLDLFPPIVNGPLWSLHYEVLYYALFPLLWAFKPRAAFVFAGALACSIAGWFGGTAFPTVISGYATGAIAWMAGWWLTRLPKQTASSRSIVSLLLLVIAHHNLEPARRLLNGLGLHANHAGMVSLADLGLVAVCIYIMASVGGRRLPGARAWAAFAWLSPALIIAALLLTHRFTESPQWWTGAGAYVAAILVHRWQPAPPMLLARLGMVSYGFYLVHFPLLFIVARLPVPGSPGLAFILRAIVWFTASVLLAALLELRLQPWIKNVLSPRPAPPSPA